MTTVRSNGQRKRVFIRTYGCQMNVYDSDRMADVLRPLGYALAPAPEQADLVVLNTCHIRERASEKVYSEIGRLRKLREERQAEGGKSLIIGIAGCVAQAEGAELMRRAPAVDLVVGPQSYHRLPEMAAEVISKGHLIDTEFPEEDKFDHLPAPSRERIIGRGPTAFLTVQEGCDKFCAFCVVPYTRGSEVSRPVIKVLDEARRLAEAGVKEITLLGQNVNGYHGEGPDGTDWSLGRLLFALAEIPGIARLRYTTSHPNDMDDALIAAHRDLKALMPYLHLPIQSGSDRILKAMNRHHTRADYLRLVEKIRAAQPDIALTSDFITGFPGETDADFADTLKILEEAAFVAAFSFKYSPRPGTPAASSGDQIPEKVKTDRLHALQAEIDGRTKAFTASRLGMTFDVLFEKKGRKAGQLVGRSPWLQPVQVMAPSDMMATLRTVTIDAIGSNSLYGTLV
jgi:tRNA-2-methylthio-N6-dimethylallyladenosine synthase